MWLDFYNNVNDQVKNTQEVQSEFWNLVYDYLDYKNDTEESNLLKEWIISKAKNLSQSEYDSLIKYINRKREKSSWDNKMQLLNLWVALTKTKPEKIQEELPPFEISGYIVAKEYDIKSPNIKNLKDFHKLKDIKFDSKKRKREILEYKAIKSWNHVYNILFKRKNSSWIHSFKIRYKWMNTVEIYDKYWRLKNRSIIKKQNIKVEEWRYNWRWKYHIETYTTPTQLKISVDDLNLYLNIIFYKK